MGQDAHQHPAGLQRHNMSHGEDKERGHVHCLFHNTY